MLQNQLWGVLNTEQSPLREELENRSGGYCPLREGGEPPIPHPLTFKENSLLLRGAGGTKNSVFLVWYAVLGGFFGNYLLDGNAVETLHPHIASCLPLKTKNILRD